MASEQTAPEQDEAVVLDEALVTERRLTVERVREVIDALDEARAALATPPPVPAAPGLDVERLRQALFTEFRRSFWGREEGWARQVSRIVADNVAPEYARLRPDQENGDG